MSLIASNDTTILFSRLHLNDNREQEEQRGQYLHQSQLVAVLSRSRSLDHQQHCNSLLVPDRDCDSE